MNPFLQTTNRRVLVIDDSSSIHEDFEKILRPVLASDELANAANSLFGEQDTRPERIQFELSHAHQGREGLEQVTHAKQGGVPFAVAFVDVRMPPGWDGIETAASIWKVDPGIQLVICTAHSDYSWEEIRERLGEPDNLLILKKPFDNIEVLQLAHALTAKWNMTCAAKSKIEQLDRAVSERTKALRQSEERFARAFGKNSVAMLIQSVETELISDVNTAFLKLVGMSPDEVIGRTPLALGLWQAPDVASMEQLIKEALLDPRSPVRLRSHAGEERKVFLSAEDFEAGGVARRLVLIDDVTERTKLEADLLQAQKMEALGQLATGVAHDFNNLLTVIQGHVSLVLSGPLAPAIHRSLSSALTASQRAANMTQQLLAFSRKQVIERKPLNLVSIFQQVEAMLARLIGDHVTVEFGRVDHLPRVYADRGNLEQVLINLAVNARDAMPKGGRLTFSATEARGLRPTASPGIASPNPGDFICLSVSDTGTGMSDAVKARIFDPFFTTKEAGRGTGMGLATVHGIVRQHQGWVAVDSEIGVGSTFRVYLPLSDSVSGSASPLPPAPCPKNAVHETVLVVEDEPAVLELVEGILRGEGYHVLTAASGLDAMKVWAEHSGVISLLFTDMMMPAGMNGKELAEKLRSLDPKLRVIYSTGYSFELIGSDFLAQGDVLLRKPYSAVALSETIRSFLDAPRSGTIPARE